ncbi:DUF3017 domain-containing protein [Streptomyces lunaelactis]|uniref:DUF3017 domain-containing protein n=1 Tax=Streptomyces lunaelactis TaxID=1535768 RepID=UPI001C3077C9|nr:DUF3017 domain-containing protein [Streptomyces lunaelactis]
MGVRTNDEPNAGPGGGTGADPKTPRPDGPDGAATEGTTASGAGAGTPDDDACVADAAYETEPTVAAEGATGRDTVGRDTVGQAGADAAAAAAAPGADAAGAPGPDTPAAPGPNAPGTTAPDAAATDTAAPHVTAPDEAAAAVLTDAKKPTRRPPSLTRDTARPEGGGRAAPGDASAPARQWPLLTVLALAGLGVIVVGTDAFADAFRVGTILLGVALITGAVMRRVLPSVGMLAVRSRFTDMVTYGLLGILIVLLALVTQPKPWLDIPFLEDAVHFTVR